MRIKHKDQAHFSFTLGQLFITWLPENQPSYYRYWRDDFARCLRLGRWHLQYGVRRAYDE